MLYLAFPFPVIITGFIVQYGLVPFSLGWGNIKWKAQGDFTLKKGFTAYPAELKLEAVRDYLSGDGSLDAMCRKYGISSHAVLQQWITLYNQGHRDFKMRRAQEENSMTESRKLSQEEKVQAVLHCIEHGLDYRQTSEQFQIAYQQIYSWVKKYQEQGEASIISYALGRGITYTNRQFNAKLDKIHATQSMSRPGRCIDNGPMEGFWVF